MTFRTLVPLLLFVALCRPGAFAQPGGVVLFDTLSHDFGEIVEGNVAEYVFGFTNAGDAPVSVTSVRASCGCTTPEWTSDPLAPGERGRIAARYASLGRPGPFRKAVAVETNGSPALITLYIEGDVVAPTINPAEAYRQGSLLFESGTIDLGAVGAGDAETLSVPLWNDGSRPVRIQDVRVPSPLVSLSFPSTPIFAGEIARIQVTVNAPADVEGPFEFPVVLVTNDDEAPEKTLHFAGHIVVGGE